MKWVLLAYIVDRINHHAGLFAYSNDRLTQAQWWEVKNGPGTRSTKKATLKTPFTPGFCGLASTVKMLSCYCKEPKHSLSYTYPSDREKSESLFSVQHVSKVCSLEMGDYMSWFVKDSPSLFVLS